MALAVVQMMLLVAAALAIQAPEPSATSSVASAAATIRIVTAVRLKLDAPINAGAPAARDSLVRTSDGTQQRARLIEFQ
ncbi:MAG: hypothetical protein ACJ8FT_06435 [Sphingomonas sp.]